MDKRKFVLIIIPVLFICAAILLICFHIQNASGSLNNTIPNSTNTSQTDAANPSNDSTTPSDGTDTTINENDKSQTESPNNNQNNEQNNNSKDPTTENNQGQTDVTTPTGPIDSTNPTDPENTKPGYEQTVPDETNPNIQNNVQVNPTTQKPNYLFSAMMFTPNHKIWDTHSTVDKWLPRTTNNWWNVRYFSTPDEETMYEDLSWLFDTESELVSRWNEFQNVIVKDMYRTGGYGVAFIVESDEEYKPGDNVTTVYTQGLVISNTDTTKTIGQSVAEGHWFYSLREMQSNWAATQQLFSAERITYASQIIHAWGIPSEIHYIDNRNYVSYALEYTFNDCKVVVYGDEYIKGDVSQGALKNITVYGLAETAQSAYDTELEKYTTAK